MKARLLFLIRYFACWLGAFIIARLVFLLYQHNQSFSLTFTTWMATFWHGLKLDLSTAGYFTLLPALVITFTSFSGYKPAYVLLKIYTILIIVVFLLITLVDLEAYKYWGTRLDSAPLRFLTKPKETLVSSSAITLIVYTAAFIGLTWLMIRLYNKTVASSLKDSGPARWTGLLVFAFITAFLVLPIRGGLGVSPINTGSVYFSKTAFANHAAVNVIWNFGHSLAEGKETQNQYVFSNRDDYDAALLKLYQYQPNPARVLKTQRPNIVLIIMESFSAKLIEPLGGTPGVTPQFNALCKEGVLFSNIYSTDSRTDKGLATVISGYPVLEAIPILRYPEKTQHLPFLSKSLIHKGYHASFLYGGDVDFANIRSYLVNGGFTDITTDRDFPAENRTGKWGVPDHISFERFLKDVQADTGNWLKVMLTLSNHEPYEVPGKPMFSNQSLIDRFYSAAWYADSCLGDFVHKLRESPVWDSTLVIMVADHGTRLPQFDDIFEPRKHHIPILWTGGALTSDSVVAKTGSQADLAITLLNQLGISTEGYVLGKDLLSPSSQSFAFYSIKNGIAMITDTSGFGFDFITNDLSYSYGKTDSSHIETAKSLQQYVFENYLRLSEK